MIDRQRAIGAIVVIVIWSIGVFRWIHALPVIDESSSVVSALSMTTQYEADSADGDAEATIVENDPFRLANSPPSVAFEPDERNPSVSAATHATSLKRRPTLTLRGIIGGPPWQAIVDGLPGRTTATPIRGGDVFESLTTRAITRDSVIIDAPDTTWVLTFRRSP